jgi:hypothetical protein
MEDEYRGNELIYFVLRWLRKEGWGGLAYTYIDEEDESENWGCQCNIDDDGFIVGCDNFDVERCMPWM